MNQLDFPAYASAARAPGLSKYHRQMLAIACAVLALAFALHELPNGRVAIRGFSRFPLPQTCASQIYFGLRCPGCGLTRSIIHLAEGDWRASWRNHRLGVVMAVVILFQIPYRWLALRHPDRTLIAPRLHAVLASILIALLVGNWLVDVVFGRISSP
jgi:Protein of unknown function (DUF2752)